MTPADLRENIDILIADRDWEKPDLSVEDETGFVFYEIVNKAIGRLSGDIREVSNRRVLWRYLVELGGNIRWNMSLDE